MEDVAEVVKMYMEMEMEMEESGDGGGDWRWLLPEAWKVTGRSAAAVREITHIDPNMGDLVGLARIFK